MNKKPLFLVSGLLAIAVMGILYFRFEQKQQLSMDKMMGCEKTGGNFQDDFCSCPTIFPNFNPTRLRCEDSYGNSPASRQEALRFEKRKNFVGECVANQKEVYVVAETPFTFCYPANWGGVRLSQAGSGTATLTFPRPGDKNLKVPELSFGSGLQHETAKTGIEQSLGDYTVRSREERGRVVFFIENVFADFNFVISGPVQIRPEIESLIQNLWYDDLAG